MTSQPYRFPRAIYTVCVASRLSPNCWEIGTGGAEKKDPPNNRISSSYRRTNCGKHFGRIMGANDLVDSADFPISMLSDQLQNEAKVARGWQVSRRSIGSCCSPSQFGRSKNMGRTRFRTAGLPISQYLHAGGNALESMRWRGKSYRAFQQAT